MQRRISTALLGAILLAPIAAAAGGHSGGHGGHDGHAIPPAMQEEHEALEARLADTSAFGEKGDPARADRTVKLTTREMQFNVDAIDVRLGETIIFEITNLGEKVHEFTLGDAPYQEAAAKMMAMMAEMGMDIASPEHEEMHADAGNTLVLRPGETRSVAWKFSKPGEVLYQCNFVGHAEAGMAGSIHVK